jgi:hypothetical protein
VGVTVGGFYFEDAFAQFQDGNIERTATEVEYGDLHVLVGFVQTVGQSGGRGFVHDAAHFQTGNFTGFLGGLTL